jgi:aminopeptidase N
VRYSARPGADRHPKLGGLGWHTTPSGGAFALGQPHSASFWYPVNDTPRDKATFRLSARVPEDWVAVSIGQEGERSTADGWTTYTWVEPNPVASYLTTVAIDKFTVDRSQLPGGIEVVSAYAPGAEQMRAVEERLPEVVEFLSEAFGDYPQSAAGGIYLDHPLGFALETQGRPTYPRWADERILVHEYAHQWFGNSVTIESWTDLCLNECLASYAEWMWAEHRGDRDLDAHYTRMVAGHRDNEAFWGNKLHKMGAGNEFDGVYDKGALAMHALRAKIGDDVFADALRDWAQRQRHGNASWPQFERFVQRRAEQDLGEFFDAWFRGEEAPDREHLCPGRLECP